MTVVRRAMRRQPPAVSQPVLDGGGRQAVAGTAVGGYHLAGVLGPNRTQRTVNALRLAGVNPAWVCPPLSTARANAT